MVADKQPNSFYLFGNIIYVFTQIRITGQTADCGW